MAWQTVVLHVYRFLAFVNDLSGKHKLWSNVVLCDRLQSFGSHVGEVFYFLSFLFFFTNYESVDCTFSKDFSQIKIWK